MLLKMELESVLWSLPADVPLVMEVCCCTSTGEAAEVQDAFLVCNIAVHSWAAAECICQG